MKCLPLQFSKIMQFPLNPLQEHLLGNVIRQLIAWQLPPWNDVSAFYTNKDSCMRPCMYIARFHFNVGIHFQPVHLNRNSSYICHIKQCSHIGIFSRIMIFRMRFYKLSHIVIIAVDAQSIDGQVCLTWCLHESRYL